MANLRDSIKLVLAQPSVFISHKREDTLLATIIRTALRQHEVSCYLDKTDAELQALGGDPRALTSHLNKILRRCSTLLVVASDQTRESWWVPYEIGYVRAVDRPVAVFDTTVEELLPDCLDGWPTLSSQAAIPRYVRWVQRRVGLKDCLRKGHITEGERTKLAASGLSAEDLEDELSRALYR